MNSTNQIEKLVAIRRYQHWKNRRARRNRAGPTGRRAHWRTTPRRRWNGRRWATLCSTSTTRPNAISVAGASVRSTAECRFPSSLRPPTARWVAIRRPRTCRWANQEPPYVAFIILTLKHLIPSTWLVIKLFFVLSFETWIKSIKQ